MLDDLTTLFVICCFACQKDWLPEKSSFRFSLKGDSKVE